MEKKNFVIPKMRVRRFSIVCMADDSEKTVARYDTQVSFKQIKPAAVQSVSAEVK